MKTAKKHAYPMEVRCRGAVVKIYREVKRHRPRFRVMWYEGDKRRTLVFEDPRLAQANARLQAESIAACERPLSLQESTDLRLLKAEFEGWGKLLVLHGRTVEEAIHDVLAVYAAFPGRLAAAVAQQLTDLVGRIKPCTVNAAIDGFLADFERPGKHRQQTTCAQMQSRLKAFAEVFGTKDIHCVRAIEIKTWLWDLKAQAGRRKGTNVSDKTRTLYYDCLHVLFTHARDILEALPRDLKTEVERVPRPKFTKPPPEAYSVDEIIKMFGLCEDVESVLYIAFGAFAGLRPCEVAALEWTDIDRDERVPIGISVHHRIAKKTKRPCRARTVPVLEPLLALIEKFAKPSGPIVDAKTGIRVHAQMKANGIRWIYDGLRHTFVSYRLKQTRDRKQTAEEAGHSIEVQAAHYEQLVTHEAAKRFWELRIATPPDLP